MGVNAVIVPPSCKRHPDVSNSPRQRLNAMRLPHLFLCFAIPLFASVDIQVDVSSGRRPISPFLYGRNNSLSDDPGRPLKASDWQFLRDAGVRILRENGGNNSTKYNWRQIGRASCRERV